MKNIVVAQTSPFKQEMLSLDECYILDNGVIRMCLFGKVCLNVHELLTLKSTL